MKNFTTLFTVFLMTFAVTLSANDDVKIYSGTISLENGETLKGQIQMLSPTLNEIKVKFIDANGKATTYKAKEVASYSFEFPKYNAKTQSYDNQTIQYVKKTVEIAPIPFGPKVVLVERQIEGTVSLYNFYTETRAAAHAFSHNYFVEKDGQLIEVTRENYKTVIKDLVADYPALQAKVGKKEHSYKYITTVINEYNTFITTEGEMFGIR